LKEITRRCFAQSQTLPNSRRSQFRDSTLVLFITRADALHRFRHIGLKANCSTNVAGFAEQLLDWAQALEGASLFSTALIGHRGRMSPQRTVARLL
jgi:hypothetical protein